MIKYTKNDFKKTAQAALKAEYGFCPPLSEITLLETAGDRTYIMFSVRGHQYQFRSGICDRGINERTGKQYECIWVGKGTIERYGE